MKEDRINELGGKSFIIKKSLQLLDCVSVPFIKELFSTKATVTATTVDTKELKGLNFMSKSLCVINENKIIRANLEKEFFI